eukprot:g17494.t1
MADDEDLWDTLHLQPGASVEEVRVAFRDLSRLYHPDKRSASGGEGENAAFVRVHRAYRILGDEDRYSEGWVAMFLHGLGSKTVPQAPEASDTVGRCLLGKEAWQFSRWRAETDDIRGGTSTASFKGLTDSSGFAEFAGLLSEVDQAFAGVSLQASFLPSLSELKGLVLDIHHGDGEEYAIALRMLGAPAGVEHVYRFQARPGSRFRLHYSALSHSVQIRLSERFSLTVGGASHVQSNSGAGAAKLMLAANTTVIPGTNVRASLNVTGTSPDAELSVGRSLSPHCFVQQKFGLSRDGRYLSLMFSPWLTRTLRGSLTGSFSSDSSLSFSLVKSSFGCGHRVRAFCDLQPESGEVGLMFKYKPVKGFSMKVSPSISRQGFGVQIICTKASSDALSKLHWALQVRTGGLGLRLTLYRCGLRFVIPVELWTEASGPLSATDIGLALAIWAAPPFVISLLRSGWLALSRLWASISLSFERVAPDDGDDNAEDVTDCLMARVRQSQLQLSNAPKSTLLGFGHHQAGDSAVLTIRYRFGGLTYTRSFGEKDVVILP